MPLNASLYLAVGSCVIEDGTGATDYTVQSMSFPAPSPDGLGGYDPAVRRVALRVRGTSVADLSANIAALRQAAARNETLYFRPSATGSTLTCRIRQASLTEPDYDPLLRSSTTAAELKTDVVLTLTTDSHWLSDWTAETTLALPTLPTTFTTPDPGGEDDALMSMRIVAAGSARGLFIGGMPGAAAGFAPIDDYGASGAGVADANALTGYKAASSALIATMAAVGTAPTFDTNANRGTYIPIVRMDSNAASVATTAYRAVQRVTGSAIAASTDVATTPVTPRAIDLVGTELPRITVPSGAVPGLESDAGWAADAITAQQTTENADTAGDFPGQTFALTGGHKLTKIVLKSGTVTGNGGLYTCEVFNASGTVAGTTSYAFASASITASNTEYEFDFGWAGWVVPATGTYAFRLRQASGIQLNWFPSKWRRNTSGGYASGNELSDTNTVVTGDDLYFKVYTQTPGGFASSTIVQASDSAAGNKIANLDYLARIPVDYAALAYRMSASSAPAIYYDGDTDIPYIADADGIGPAILDKAEVIKPLRAKPGVINTYVLAVTDDDVAVAGATVKYKTRARYLNATG